MAKDPEPDSIWVALRTQQEVQINCIMQRNYSYWSGNWHPSVRFTDYPNRGNVYYLALPHFLYLYELKQEVK